ncbi:MAG: hypothetical protein KBD00_00670 [Candidatus Peribacteraceae bacterium]|nr:hypothetical protein [Candidatus Peribacteraceae bacterium]
MYRYLTLITCSLLLAACVSSVEKKTESAPLTAQTTIVGDRLYRNEAYNFQISYPQALMFETYFISQSNGENKYTVGRDPRLSTLLNGAKLPIRDKYWGCREPKFSIAFYDSLSSKDPLDNAFNFIDVTVCPKQQSIRVDECQESGGLSFNYSKSGELGFTSYCKHDEYDYLFTNFNINHEIAQKMLASFLVGPLDIEDEVLEN